jgi:hypothetical protein
VRPRILVLRYFLTNVFLLCFVAALMFGTWPIWVILGLAMLTGGGIDEAIGDDHAQLADSGRLFFDANLYATLPLLVTLTCLLLALIAWGPGLGFEGLNRSTAPRESSALVGAVVGTGYFYALAGVTVAHELTHRLGNPAALLSARVLLAFTLNPTFESYHLQGHHRNVCTYGDAATARRGEYVLAFVVRTIIHQSLQGWRLESVRLRHKGLGVWSLRNRILSGLLCSTLILTAAGLITGIGGIAAFLAAAVFGRMLHEMVNYVQHYGLVRSEGAAIEARHSWDCYRLLSNALQYNLPRHADHHLLASKPFWNLSAVADSPKLPHGYETMSMISLFPRWWHHLMDKRLADWDERLANDLERSIVHARGWAILDRP